MGDENYAYVTGVFIPLTEEFKKPKITQVYFGWENYTGTISREDNKTRLSFNAYLQYFNEKPIAISPTATNNFLDTLRLAKENGINVILIKYPSHGSIGLTQICA